MSSIHSADSKSNENLTICDFNFPNNKNSGSKESVPDSIQKRTKRKIEKSTKINLESEEKLTDYNLRSCKKENDMFKGILYHSTPKGIKKRKVDDKSNLNSSVVHGEATQGIITSYYSRNIEEEISLEDSKINGAIEAKSESFEILTTNNVNTQSLSKQSTTSTRKSKLMISEVQPIVLLDRLNDSVLEKFLIKKLKTADNNFGSDKLADEYVKPSEFGIKYTLSSNILSANRPMFQTAEEHYDGNIETNSLLMEKKCETNGTNSNSPQNITVDIKKDDAKQFTKVNMIKSEIDFLGYDHQLRTSLNIAQPNYEMALETLQQLLEKMNYHLLKENRNVIDTVEKVTQYIGNANEWNLNEQEVIEHYKIAELIRYKAQKVLLMFKCLLTVNEGHMFQENNNGFKGFSENFQD